MKRIPVILLALALSLGLMLPCFADVLTPGAALILGLERNLPVVLIIAVLIVTAILVRKFTKKK